MHTFTLRRVLLSAVLVAGLLLLGAGWRTAARDLREPVDLSEVEYVRSGACADCHPGRHRTWRRTYHRTMTQAAGPGSVLGDFENASYTYQDVPTYFRREGDRYFMETRAKDGGRFRFEIAMTVGSRRIQQYVAKVGDRHLRLPLAWNIEEERWFHLNGGFLHPDGQDFNNHTAVWDANCIFCHNVKARPGFSFEDYTFDSSVEEMGIACEACHGPGGEHVARNQSRLRRWLLYLTGGDPTAVSPNDLDPFRQTQLCGHCHGQRVPNPLDRIEEMMTVGDPYTAGDDLDRFTAPLFIHTEVEGIDAAVRFWRDGTPRLTAYEYQGLLLSEEHRDTDLSCMSCHTMHGGDPEGMLEPAIRAGEGCVQCHGSIGADVGAHTKHAPAGTGSDCYACHMPKITYGVLGIHRSHRIRNPDPTRSWRFEMPEACTVCHTDKTAVWAAEETARLWELPPPGGPPSGFPARLAETVRAALSGDVVQRAVAVDALAAEASYTDDPIARLWAVPFLLVSMEDRYPAIRHFAHRGLRRLREGAAAAEPGSMWATPELPEFDYLADAAVRERVVEKWWTWWREADKSNIPHPGPAVPLDGNLQPLLVVADLVALQDDKIIEVGE